MTMRLILVAVAHQRDVPPTPKLLNQPQREFLTVILDPLIGLIEGSAATEEFAPIPTPEETAVLENTTLQLPFSARTSPSSAIPPPPPPHHPANTAAAAAAWPRPPQAAGKPTPPSSSAPESLRSPEQHPEAHRRSLVGVGVAPLAHRLNQRVLDWRSVCELAKCILERGQHPALLMNEVTRPLRRAWRDRVYRVPRRPQAPARRHTPLPAPPRDCRNKRCGRGLADGVRMAQ
jgi:hypothetical protein